MFAAFAFYVFSSFTCWIEVVFSSSSFVFRIRIRNGLIISNTDARQQREISTVFFSSMHVQWKTCINSIPSLCVAACFRMTIFFFALTLFFHLLFQSSVQIQASSRYVASINSREIFKVNFVVQADGKLISIIVVLVFCAYYSVWLCTYYFFLSILWLLFLYSNLLLNSTLLWPFDVLLNNIQNLKCKYATSNRAKSVASISIITCEYGTSCVCRCQSPKKKKRKKKKK